MKTKELVLNQLIVANGQYVSGQYLADMLGISRSAIAKAIKSIEKNYSVSAVTNKGYALNNADILNCFAIQKYTDCSKIMIYDEVDSTNNIAKKLASEGQRNCTVIAKKQTNGRGRLGKTFVCDDDKSIYMTMIINPKKGIVDAGFYTIAASVAVFRAIKNELSINLGIKWVNDLFYNGKKCVGILTEATIDYESGNVESIVVGIGINVYKFNYPDELKDIVTYLSDNVGSINRNKVIASIINNYYDILNSDDNSSVLEDYRRESIVIGRQIKTQINGKEIEAKAKSILDNGNLVIATSDAEYVLKAGEISIKL